MRIVCVPAVNPSIARRNGTTPPSGYLALLPFRLPFCQAALRLAHWSRLTPTAAREGDGNAMSQNVARRIADARFANDSNRSQAEPWAIPSTPFELDIGASAGPAVEGDGTTSGYT